jgi:enoyl-CoA hydratase/carnithine racemase
VWGWRQLPVPIIAAIQGVAFGGGFQLALGADMRFLTPDARMSIMEIKWGWCPTWRVRRSWRAWCATISCAS